MQGFASARPEFHRPHPSQLVPCGGAGLEAAASGAGASPGSGGGTQPVPLALEHLSTGHCLLESPVCLMFQPLVCSQSIS